MQYSGHVYTKILFISFLEFEFNQHLCFHSLSLAALPDTPGCSVTPQPWGLSICG